MAALLSESRRAGPAQIRYRDVVPRVVVSLTTMTIPDSDVCVGIGTAISPTSMQIKLNVPSPA
jgi:hypothetical protein